MECDQDWVDGEEWEGSDPPSEGADEEWNVSGVLRWLWAVNGGMPTGAVDDDCPVWLPVFCAPLDWAGDWGAVRAFKDGDEDLRDGDPKWGLK